MEKIKTFLQSEHVEVTFRMSTAMFLGYVLTYANISAIPIETNILLGILVPFCTMLFPTLMFAFGSIIAPLFSLFMLIYLSSSLLHVSAVVGGNGFFVAVFSVWCFWITFFRFDKTEGNKTSLVLIGVVFQTMLIYPTFSTVQNGIIIPDQYLPPKIAEAMTLLVEDAVQVATNLGVGTHMIDITSGTLAGRTAEITIFSDGTSKTFIEGGMWLVRGMWTFTGTQNPLASYTNIMIFVLWLMLLLSIAVLMPPFRTMRSAIWRGIIPPAMKDAAKSIRLHAARMEMHAKTKTMSDVENDNMVDNQQLKELDGLDTSEGTRLATRGRCVYHINALFGGNLAKYTFFEPRLLECKPSVCSAGILMQLSGAVSRCVRIAVGIELLARMDDETDFIHNNINEYLEVASTLEVCARAMLVGDANILNDIETTEPKKTPSMPEKGDYKAVASDDDAILDNSLKKMCYDPFQFKNRTDEVVALSRKWLEAMSPDRNKQERFSTASLNALYYNIYPWVFVQFSHFLFLGQLLRDLFKKSTWQALLYPSKKNNLSRLVWCIKYTIGMTTLLIVSIYWTTFRTEFVVATSKDDPNRDIYVVQNAGWTIVAYCFATTQTAEGSVKKGVLRMAGTVAGAFSAWLALLACEDHSFPLKHNTYGLVAWLTITSAVATYISTERGFAARISLSNDYAYGPIYFVLTQVIIVAYGCYYFGPEARDELTINRMLANLIGILLAVILAVLPPGLWGGDPKHCKSMNLLHWDTTLEVIQQLLSCPLIPDTGDPVQDFCEDTANSLLQLGEKIQAQSSIQQEMAVDFEKDAARLQKLPRFQIDPKLKVEIAKVTRDIYITTFIPVLAANILKDPQKQVLLLGRESYGRKELEAILADMNRGIKATGIPSDNVPEPAETIPTSPVSNDSKDGEYDVELLIRTLHWIKDEMHKHEEVLDTIKWGF